MGSTESLLSNRGLEINAKTCLYERVIVPTALYGTDTLGMRRAERRKCSSDEMFEKFCRSDTNG